MSGPTYQYKTSLTVIYFGLGFIAGALPTALAVTVARPYIIEGPAALRILAMLAPVLFGVLFGVRTALVGRREQVRLAPALARAFFFGGR